MQITPYLSFHGQCEVAFKYYEQCLGGKLVAMMTYGGSPMAAQVPPEHHGWIMHARLVAGGAVLMGSDGPPDAYAPGKGCVVSIGVDDPAEAERVFGALADGATVQMPLQETFWARRFGMLVDRFGTPWMVNCEKPGVV